MKVIEQIISNGTFLSFYESLKLAYKEYVYKCYGSSSKYGLIAIYFVFFKQLKDSVRERRGVHSLFTTSLMRLRHAKELLNVCSHPQLDFEGYLTDSYCRM